MTRVKKNAAAVLALAAFVIETRADFCSPQSAGMRDIMLVYAQAGGWRAENFRPYVAYLDRAGKPVDWFYDAYLFLMFGGAPSGQAYIDGATDRKDWEYYLNEEFAADREFAALEATVESVAQALHVPAPTVPVIAMIPYPSAKQKAFGDADGDGATENLSADSDREKAVAWFLREFLLRWNSRSFRHLKLWGFYWMNEGVSPADESIVRAAARAVHGRDYKFLWIPWFRAPGVEKWRELGFDLAIMQPNYAFIPPSGRLRVPDENRLTTAANVCRRLGMGVEMELNMGLDLDAHRDAPVDLRDRINLRLYLNHGDATLDGYRDGAVRAYYQGYNAIAGLGVSADPALRCLYDDLYRFHKGTYAPHPPYQPLAAPEACLTDGRWRTRPDAAVKAVVLSGPQAMLTLPLEGPRLADDVRVHFAGDVPPQRVRLAVSASPSGGDFEEVAAVDEIALRPEDGGGFVTLTFPVRTVRQLRLTVETRVGESVAVDEVLLMPSAHLLCGSPYVVTDRAADPWGCLTDGVAGGGEKAVWPGARGEVRFDLPEAWYAKALMVHFRKTEGKAFSPRVSSDAGSADADREGWATIPLNREVRALSLALEDSAAGRVAVDEVALLPARNLALGCAYTYDPPFRARYPDSGGRELTDGEVSGGFGDGKTVGWAEWSGAHEVAVCLDLGASYALEAAEAHVQGGGYASVNFPERVAVFVSEDGLAWTRAATSVGAPEKTASRDVGGSRCELGWVRLALPGVRGRYVRFRFEPKGWLMLSEVRVFSSGKNIAQNLPYSLNPQPVGEETYADNTGLLMDGYYVKAGSGWKACAGFDKADPTVTADLGVVRRVQAARLHVQGGGPGGVRFPDRVTMETSVDGTAWLFAGETSEHPAEDGRKAAAAFMGAVFEPRDARFVRFRVKRRGWAMLDEIEVLPTW